MGWTDWVGGALNPVSGIMGTVASAGGSELFDTGTITAGFDFLVGNPTTAIFESEFFDTPELELSPEERAVFDQMNQAVNGIYDVAGISIDPATGEYTTKGMDEMLPDSYDLAESAKTNLQGIMNWLGTSAGINSFVSGLFNDSITSVNTILDTATTQVTTGLDTAIGNVDKFINTANQFIELAKDNGQSAASAIQYMKSVADSSPEAFQKIVDSQRLELNEAQTAAFGRITELYDQASVQMDQAISQQATQIVQKYNERDALLGRNPNNQTVLSMIEETNGVISNAKATMAMSQAGNATELEKAFGQLRGDLQQRELEAQQIAAKFRIGVGEQELGQAQFAAEQKLKAGIAQADVTMKGADLQSQLAAKRATEQSALAQQKASSLTSLTESRAATALGGINAANTAASIAQGFQETEAGLLATRINASAAGLSGLQSTLEAQVALRQPSPFTQSMAPVGAVGSILGGIFGG